MANVLVLIDHHDRTPAPSAGPLLGVAARFGTPVAVAVTGGGDTQPLVDKLGSLGAAYVHLVTSPEACRELVGPAVAAMECAATVYSPSVVLDAEEVSVQDAADRF